jgi:hypothetical protein
MKTDFQRLFRAIGDVMLEALKPITAKLVELEARKPEKGDKGDKGNPGESVTLEQIEALIGKTLSPLRKTVDDAVAAIPTPKDGTSVVIADVEPLIAQLFTRYAQATDSRLPGMLADAAAGLPKPKDGNDGTSVTLEQLQPMVMRLFDQWSSNATESLDKAIAAMPGPKDGKDGTSVTIEQLQPMVKQLFDEWSGNAKESIGKALAAIPAAKDGKDGTSVTLEDLAARLQPAHAELVKDFLRELRAEALEIVKGLPKPKDGSDGDDGKSVLIDDVLPVLDGAVAKWMLEVERRIMDLAQRAIEAMPKPRDGVDGINASDFTFNFDHDTRTISIRHGDRIVLSQRICIPKYIDVWTETFGTYEEGFIVTFGGHGWIAKRDTASKPGTDDSWQLFVKKGRDGK